MTISTVYLVIQSKIQKVHLGACILRVLNNILNCDFKNNYICSN